MNDELEVVTLSTPLGEVDVVIYKEFSVENNSYLAVIPYRQIEKENAEILIYGYIIEKNENGENEIVLKTLSDDEFESASDILNKLIADDIERENSSP